MADWVTDAWLLVYQWMFSCCDWVVNWIIDWLFNWLSGRLFESWLKANFVLSSCHVAIDSSVHFLIIISDKMIGYHLANWALINLSSMINYCNPSYYKSLCTVCVRVFSYQTDFHSFGCRFDTVGFSQADLVHVLPAYRTSLDPMNHR